ncbi:YraN family protein [bacterium]|nr:YraN family protein [bacterium]
MTRERQTAGRAGQDAAERWLRRAGYVILARNYRCAAGEIDLVALDRRVVVFVEVKTRRRPLLSPLDAVTASQQRRIVSAATDYLSRHRLSGRPLRFDLVGVWLDGAAPRCELVRGAFGGDDG